MTRYISAEQLAERYGVNKSTIWRWVQNDTLPQPIRISDQCTRWQLNEIEERDAAREVAVASPRVMKATEASLHKREGNKRAA